MKLNESEKRDLIRIRRELSQTGPFRQMKEYTQHGSVTTYSHVCSVAAMSCVLARPFGKRVDRDLLIRGALLHDFYLYDWHENKLMQLHGFHHPGIARQKAVEYYGIDEKTQNLIHSHMWPMTLTILPRSPEAFLVSLADKLVSLNETLFCRKGKSNQDTHAVEDSTQGNE